MDDWEVRQYPYFRKPPNHVPLVLEAAPMAAAQATGIGLDLEDRMAEALPTDPQFCLSILYATIATIHFEETLSHFDHLSHIQMMLRLPCAKCPITSIGF